MQLQNKINELGRLGVPFVFCINYDKTDGFAYPKDAIPDSIKIEMGQKPQNKLKPPKIIDKQPIAYRTYLDKIETLKEHIRMGDIYLANMTCETKIELDGTLENIFDASFAPYKLLIKDSVVIHSPEEFVRIEDGTISTYPMKGTALYENDESVARLLENQKELAEHTMVVDLLRNDISMVAANVKVEKFRYPLFVEADGKKLIQTISKITGSLEENYTQKLGDILFSLLPAGSVTGTPKKKCVEILKAVESYERGYYCGIFGEFDGKTLRSAVSIRYIEKKADGLVYKSGGGITIESDPKSEYDEMIKKVYLAF
jgi:para-aminobenzoate synthetase component 1